MPNKSLATLTTSNAKLHNARIAWSIPTLGDFLCPMGSYVARSIEQIHQKWLTCKWCFGPEAATLKEHIRWLTGRPAGWPTAFSVIWPAALPSRVHLSPYSNYVKVVVFVYWDVALIDFSFATGSSLAIGVKISSSRSKGSGSLD